MKKALIILALGLSPALMMGQGRNSLVIRRDSLRHEIRLNLRKADVCEKAFNTCGALAIVAGIASYYTYAQTHGNRAITIPAGIAISGLSFGLLANHYEQKAGRLKRLR